MLFRSALLRGWVSCKLVLSFDVIDDEVREFLTK